MTENGEVAAREAALVARIAEGDNDEALRALYRRYGRPVYGLGMRMLNDRGLAEELVQDTFVRPGARHPASTPASPACAPSSSPLPVDVGTVKTRSFYALRALRLELEERGLVG